MVNVCHLHKAIGLRAKCGRSKLIKMSLRQQQNTFLVLLYGRYMLNF